MTSSAFRKAKHRHASVIEALSFGYNDISMLKRFIF